MPVLETVAKEGSNPGSLDCGSGILRLSYRDPHATLQLKGSVDCHRVLVFVNNTFILFAASNAETEDTPHAGMHHLHPHSHDRVVESTT